jgi:nitrous oxidase accessory protein
MRTRPILKLFVLLLPASVAPAAPVRTAEALVAAVAGAKPGDVIELAEGVYRPTRTLEVPGGITLRGAGIDKTIVTHEDSWKPSTESLPDPEMRLEGLDTEAYLIRIRRDTQGVTISDMTLLGPQLHGAVFSWLHTGLHLHHLRIKDTLWCGVRTFGMKQAKIHDCEWVNAVIRWEKGQPGLKGGNTGGGLFARWMADSEIWNNRFIENRTEQHQHYYGIKARQGIRVRIHHHSIEAGFSIEMPFENDEDVEIDHNVLHAAGSWGAA